MKILGCIRHKWKGTKCLRCGVRMDKYGKKRRKDKIYKRYTLGWRR